MTDVENLRVCQICNSDALSMLTPGILLRPIIAELIRKETGNWTEEGWICKDDLQRFRHQYVQSLLQKEKGELTLLENEMLERLVEIQEIQMELISEVRGRR